MISIGFIVYLLFVCITYVTFRTHRTINKILELELEVLNTIPGQLLVFMLAVVWPFLIVLGCLFFLLYGFIIILESIVSFIKGVKNE